MGLKGFNPFEANVADDIQTCNFVIDRVNDPFQLKCRQLFHGPQEIQVGGYITFGYNEKGKGELSFYFNHPIDNQKIFATISLPFISSFTLIKPDSNKSISGGLIILLTTGSGAKLTRMMGTETMIADKMKGETRRSQYENVNKLMFVLEGFEGMDKFFKCNLTSEKSTFYPFSALVDRFSWVLKKRSCDIKKGVSNENGNVFEICTEEGYSKYLERNRLVCIPFNPETGSNYQFKLPCPSTHKIDDDFSRKTKEFKKLIIGKPGQFLAATEEDPFHPAEDLKNQKTQNGAADSKKRASAPLPITGTPVNKGIAPVTSATEQSRRQVRRKVETISLSDDEDEQSPASQKSSSSGDEPIAEPPEKKQRISGDTPLVRFPRTGRDFVELRFDDLRVMAHGEMLNDTIVEFYIKFIVHRLVKKTDVSKIHVFNTFFYQKLTERPPLNVLGKSERAGNLRFNWIKNNYKFVKSWTKKAKIFEKDYIVIPINDDMHWYVVIVIRPALAVKSQMNLDPSSRKKGASRPDPDTHIVVLDSLKDNTDPKRQCVVDIIRDYLECELEDKKSLPGTLVRTHLAAVHPEDVPRQQNYIDCGLFLLGFVQEFLVNPVSSKQLNEPHGSWMKWYPQFNVKMKFMRTKVLRFIENVADPMKLKLLREYEKIQGKGATVATLEGIVDEARKPRRHSFTEYFEKNHHPRFKSRCPSEPPDPKNHPPPAGINVAKH